MSGLKQKQIDRMTEQEKWSNHYRALADAKRDDEIAALRARLAAADVINRPCGKPTHQIRGPAEEDRHLCLECVIEQQREHAAQLAAEVNALAARLAAAETAIEPLRKLAEASVGQRREARKWALLALRDYDAARGEK